MTGDVVDPEIFHPGTNALLEVRDTRNKFTTFFRGLKNKDYLILDHPAKDGKPVALGDESSVIVRFIHEGQVIGFRSKVLAVIRTPYPLVFIRFPQTVESSRLRKHERYPVQIETVCSKKRLNGLVDSHPRDLLLNISTGGCQIETFETYDKDTVLYLTIFLPGTNPVVDLETEVKRVDRRANKYLVGVAFTDLLDPTYEAIRAFLGTMRNFQVRA